MEFFIIILIVDLIFAMICYKLAESNGRSKWLAFALGFIFGIFGLIGYLIAGESNDRKVKKLAEAIKKSK